MAAGNVKCYAVAVEARYYQMVIYIVIHFRDCIELRENERTLVGNGGFIVDRGPFLVRRGI